MVLSKSEFLYLIGIVSMTILMLVAFFIVVMIYNIKIRKQKEIEKLNAIITTQENERTRIAEDMHDEIGPMLSAIKLMISSFSKSDDITELNSQIQQASNHLDSVIQNIRNIVRNLSSANLHKIGLIQSLEDFRSIIERDNRIRFVLNHEGIIGQWIEEAEVNIYRILYELINNSIKHSNCNEIRILFHAFENTFEIFYSDNGHAESNLIVLGMGIRNVETRVKGLNGKLIKNDEFTEGAMYHIILENKYLFQASEHGTTQSIS